MRFNYKLASPLKLYFCNTRMMSRPFFLFLLVIFSSSVFAQKEEVPIGEWRIHLPYNDVHSITESPTHLYVGAERGFYSFHKKSGEMELYSKVNGFSDVEVSLVKYHAGLDLLFIAYDNTNIDILQGNSIYNISDVLRKSILGEKAINDILFEGNLAYLSCTFGIVIIDLEKKAVMDSYLNIGAGGNSTVVNSVGFYGDSIYAATEQGILFAPKTGLNLSDFNSWSGPIALQNPGNARMLRVFGNKIFVEVSQLLRYYDGTNWNYMGDTIPQYKRDTRSMEICHGQLIYVQVTDTAYKEVHPWIAIMKPDGTQRFIKENFNNFAIIDDENSIWTGGNGTGLVKINQSGQYSYTRPNGPQRPTSFSMTPINNELWVAGGGTSPQWHPIFNKARFYRFENGLWKKQLGDTTHLSKMYDALVVAGNESTGEVFVASHGAGLFHIKGESIVNVFDNDNSLLTKGGDYVQVDGLAFDSKNNLWISNYDSPKGLKMLSKDGKWNQYDIGITRPTEMVIDRFDQKWIINHDNTSVGIVVFKESEDPNSTSHQLLHLENTAGKGGLPSSEVNALIVDEDGEIWVGTSEGLAVFYNPGGVFENPEFAEAKRFIIDDGKDVGYLLGSEVINDIQIDGANRKWVATNTGVWLIAADGSEVIRHFTEQNSPLLSNQVSCVGILPETGEVFFGTSKGIVSYRGDATGAGNMHGKVVIFPNPVRPGYDGPITITGLPTNATVKITDISGRVVYEMISNGGTAVWDGNNFHGERAQTGIYLFITANEEEDDAHVTKLLLVN